MASGGVSSLSAEVISFDIFDGTILSDDNSVTQKLTQDEREEICRLVNEMEGVNSAELVDLPHNNLSLQTHQTHNTKQLQIKN